MSNLIRNQWKQYYQLPCLPPELEASLSPGAFRYYAFLWLKLNKHSAPVLEFSVQEIAHFTGIKDPKTLCKARTQLMRAGLIAVERVPPGIYRHTMLNCDGEAIPAPKDRRGMRMYERKSGGPNEAAPRKPVSAANASSISIPSPKSRCRIHDDNAGYWIREGELLCARCHPDPKQSIAPPKSEVGFD